MRFMKNIQQELDKIVDYFTESNQGKKLIAAINRVIKSSLIENRKRKTTEQSIASFDLPIEVLKMLC